MDLFTFVYISLVIYLQLYSKIDREIINIITFILVIMILERLTRKNDMIEGLLSQSNISNEAIQNVAAMIENGDLKVGNFTVDGDLVVNGKTTINDVCTVNAENNNSAAFIVNGVTSLRSGHVSIKNTLLLGEGNSLTALKPQNGSILIENDEVQIGKTMKTKFKHITDAEAGFLKSQKALNIDTPSGYKLAVNKDIVDTL